MRLAESLKTSQITILQPEIMSKMTRRMYSYHHSRIEFYRHTLDHMCAQKTKYDLVFMREILEQRAEAEVKEVVQKATRYVRLPSSMLQALKRADYWSLAATLKYRHSFSISNVSESAMLVTSSTAYSSAPRNLGKLLSPQHPGRP